MLVVHKTDILNKEHVAKAVSRAFLETVPAQFHTHCVFCSRVVSSCLENLGLPSRVAPCQLMCTSEGKSVLLGFTGTAPHDKWDGHAVVRWNDLLFDFATASFKRDYGIELPAVVIAPCTRLPSNLKANIVAGGVRMMWLRPPPGADATLPDIDPGVIEKYSARLLSRTRQLLG